MTMTDPQAGTRRYRARMARLAAADVEAWTEGRGRYAADPTGRLDPETIGNLTSCARWLLELLEAEAPAQAGPRPVGRANMAVAHLDTRQMRDVLNVLALTVPAAVLDAIAEAGH